MTTAIPIPNPLIPLGSAPANISEIGPDCIYPAIAAIIAPTIAMAAGILRSGSFPSMDEKNLSGRARRSSRLIIPYYLA